MKIDDSIEEADNYEELEDSFEHQVITVDPGQSALRLDKFLVDKLTKLSRQRIQIGIKSGAFTVNDQEVRPNYKVKPWDIIQCTLPRISDEFSQVQPENIPLKIVYEDEYLMVVYKEPGRVVHPGYGNKSGTLVNALAYYLQSETLPVLEGNSLDRPCLVHRIDKDTSGLLLVAKEEYTLSHLAKQFFNHTIERTYFALVWGSPQPSEGTIKHNLIRNPRNRLQFMGTLNSEEGKSAITHYKIIEDFYYVSLVECKLETGRTHQIRAHFATIGHPLFNDGRYGGDKIHKGTIFTRYKQFVDNCFVLLPRQALHAASLGFQHPISNQWIQLNSPLPDDMNSVIDKWRSYYLDRKNKI
jgi:23S rRNA pseudouridine1911/1915/1917 synthase